MPDLSNEETERDNEKTQLLNDDKVNGVVPHSRRRWFVLMTLSLNTIMTGQMFTSLVPVNNVVRQYYSAPSTAIEWLGNVFILGYILLSIPATYIIGRLRVRLVLCFCAACNLIATFFHAAGYGPKGFPLIVVGQVIATFAMAFLIQMPTKVSYLWFPEHERARATAVGVNSIFIGCALGYLHSSMSITGGEGTQKQMKKFFVIQVVEAAVVLAITYLHFSKCILPGNELDNNTTESESTESEATPKVGFLEGLDIMRSNKRFAALSLSCGIYIGLQCSVQVLINPIVTSYFHGSQYNSGIGWMGFWNNIVGIAASLFIGILMDKSRSYRAAALLLNSFSLIIWISLIVVITSTKSFVAVCTLYVIFAIVYLPFNATSVQQAAEMMKGVPEEMSNNMLFWSSNLCGFVFTFVFGEVIQAGYVRVAGYCMAGLYLVSSVLAMFTGIENAH